MNKVFLLQNQNKQLLGKNGEWLDGRNPVALYRSLHRDEAINQQFEMGSKDYNLRIQLLLCDTTPKKQPIIAADDLPELKAPEPTEADNIEPGKQNLSPDQNAPAKASSLFS